MAHRSLMNADKMDTSARSHSCLSDIGQGEEDEALALGAEAYAWCCPLMFAAGAATDESSE